MKETKALPSLRSLLRNMVILASWASSDLNKGLDEMMTGKLKELLDSQIAGLLTRIDEEMGSLQSEDQTGQIQEADEENSYQEE